MDIASDVGKLVINPLHSNHLLTILTTIPGWLLEAARSQRSLHCQSK